MINPFQTASRSPSSTTHRRSLSWALVALVLISVSGCDRAEQELSVSNGWVRLSPPDSMMTAGYGTFTNTGKLPLTLQAYSSPQFGDVTLHYTEDVNGTATMREAKDFTLKPGDTLELSPGGYHLMLMQRTEATPEDSNVEVTFEFKSGLKASHSFKVTRR